MKQILLIPGLALSNKMEIKVMDFPSGLPESDIEAAARKRCTITVEYGRPDAMELINKGMNLEGAMEHYNSYIYDLVKFRILSDWAAVGGLKESLDIVRDKIKTYFEEA